MMNELPPIGSMVILDTYSDSRSQNVGKVIEHRRVAIGLPGYLKYETWPVVSFFEDGSHEWVLPLQDLIYATEEDKCNFGRRRRYHYQRGLK